MRTFFILLFAVSLHGQVVVTGDRIDLSHAGATRPVKIVSVLPTGVSPQLGCLPGDMVQLSTAAPGQRIYINTATGVCNWVQQTGGGTGGGGLQDPGANGVVKRTALNTTAVALAGDITSLFGICIGTQYLGADGFCHSTLPDPGANGIIKRTAPNVTGTAVFGDIVALFSACSGTQYLGADGACHTASAGGGLADPGANGPIKRTALNVTAPSVFGDIVGLWSGCSGTLLLGADGFCHTGGGGGSGSSYVVGASGTCTSGVCSQTVLASVHGQGMNAVTFCFSGGVSGSTTTGHLVTCDYQKDVFGNMTVRWGGTSVSSIQIFSSGAGAQGPPGPGASPGGSDNSTQVNSLGAFAGISPTSGTKSYYKWSGSAYTFGNIDTGGTGALDCATTPGVCDINTSVVPRFGQAWTQTGLVNFLGSSSTAPNRSGAGSPNARDACTRVGETYFQSDASAGSNMWGCTATGTPGTWSQLGSPSIGAVPYVTNATTPSGQTITAVTHGQGINPSVQCWSGSVTSSATTGNLVGCAVSKNAAGDVTVYWTSGIGSIEVMASGPGPAGGGGGGGTPGGTNTQVQWNCAGSFCGFTASGDATINTSTGVVNVTQTHLASALPVAQGGTGATTVSGVLKGNGTSAIGAAAAADVVGLFSTCSGTQYLGADGACHTPPSAGSVTTTGAMSAFSIVTAAGASSIDGTNHGATMNTSGDIVTTGLLTSGKALQLVQGSPPSVFGIPSFAFVTNPSITSYQWQVPSADCAGPLQSDGAGSPGHITCASTTGTGNLLRASAAAPATSGSSPLKGNGSGGTAAAAASDIVALFSACSGTQYLGADGSCHAGGGGGLADPGSNGVVKRTALNTTAVAVSADIVGMFSGTCTGGNLLGADGACHAPTGTPGGTNGQFQVNNTGAFAGVTISGDLVISGTTGVGTVTKTGGAPFAASATTDTTNAANISSGVLGVARGGTAAGTLSGVLKGNGTSAIGSAAATDVVALFSTCSGSQYLGADGACHSAAPATSGSAPLKGNGTGGTASATAADIVGLFSTCSGTQYLGADGACHSATGGGTVTGVTGTSPIASSGGAAPAISCPTCLTTATSFSGPAVTGTSAGLYAFNDIRRSPFNAVCNGSNQHAAVLALLNAGLTSMFIPAGCNWTLPHGSGGAHWSYNPGTGTITIPDDSVPGNLTIVGENWVTSTIQTATPGSQTMYIGPQTILEKVNVQNAACNVQQYWTGTYIPGAVCPMVFYMNGSRRYSGTVNTSGTSITYSTGDQFLYDPTGQSSWTSNSLTNPTPELNINGTYYTVTSVSQSGGSCSGSAFGATCLSTSASAGTQFGVPYFFDQYRPLGGDGYQFISMATRGPGDFNALQAGGFGGDTFFAGCNDPGCVAFRGSAVLGDIFYAQRQGNGVGYYMVDDPGATSGFGFRSETTHRTSGTYMSFYQSTTNWSGGAGINFDFASSSGSFTGSYIHADYNLQTKFDVNQDGQVKLFGIQGITGSVAGSAIYFGSASDANAFIDRNTTGGGGDLIFGYNSPRGTSGAYDAFTIYDNSTNRNAMFKVTSQGSSGASQVAMPSLPTSTGGSNVCVDGSGNLYKKSGGC